MRMYDIIAKKRDGGTLTQEAVSYTHLEKKAPLCAGLLRAVHTRRAALCKRSRALLFYTG